MCKRARGVLFLLSEKTYATLKEMTAILFIIIIIVLVVFLTKKPQAGSDDAGYHKGYNDGWRALGAQIENALHEDKLNKDAIRAVVASEPDSGAISVHVPHKQASQRTAKKHVVDDEKRSLHNTNIVLYLASFLFVAAGAAFIGAAVDDTVKLFGVWLLVAAFYGAGLYMHANMPKLRPAAVAFVGTGMALLPFAGVALHQYGGASSEFAWMLTSLVGVVAYYWVAIRLNSLVVSYLTLAFVISLVSGCVATASLPIVWGFTSVIAVSLAASLVSYVRPSWLPAIFSTPVERTGQIVTPVTLVASLFVYDNLSLQGYEVVFSVATAHYVVAWLQSRQDAYENAARVVAHMAWLFFAWDFSAGSLILFGGWFLILATLQLVYSLLRQKQGYEIWLWAAMALQLFANTYWVGSEHSMTLVSYGLAVLGASSFVAGYLLRSVKLALPGLGVTVLLPSIVMRGAIEPHLGWGWVVSWYLLSAIAALFAYMQWAGKRSHDFKMFVAGGFMLYAVSAAILSLVLGNGAGAATMAALTVLLFVASYIMATPGLVVVGAFTLAIAALRFWTYNDWSQDWAAVGITWAVDIVLIGISWVMLAMDDERRRPLVLYSVWVVGGFGAIVPFFGGASDSISFAAALLVLVLGLSVFLEGRRSQRSRMVETGIYIATLGAQRMFGVQFPELNAIFYAHWWAATIAAFAIVRSHYMPRLMIAMGFITAVTGVYALGNGDSYSLLFLVEHIALVLAGVYFSKSWAVWWGIIASSLAVLYFLRDIAYAAFGFLGLLLIGFVMWRLTRQNDDKSHNG